MYFQGNLEGSDEPDLWCLAGVQILVSSFSRSHPIKNRINIEKIIPPTPFLQQFHDIHASAKKINYFFVLGI